jgi:hypothetical protein
MIHVHIETGEIGGAIRRLRRHIGDSGRITQTIGLTLREYVRETITRGGRRRTYAPLSWWTRQRTGRTRPLLPLRPGIKYTADSTTVTVFYDGDRVNPWDTWMHHGGYTIPARSGRMYVPFRRGGGAFFTRARAAAVPAREIWPTQREVRDEVRAMVTRWINEGVTAAWRR